VCTGRLCDCQRLLPYYSDRHVIKHPEKILATFNTMYLHPKMKQKLKRRPRCGIGIIQSEIQFAAPYQLIDTSTDS
jgi:hypothetical protein